jgi:hypothetical protein
MSIVGQFILLSKLQRQRSDDTSAFDMGNAISGIRNGAPASAFGGLNFSYLDGNPQQAFGVFVHAMADNFASSALKIGFFAIGPRPLAVTVAGNCRGRRYQLRFARNQLFFKL